MTIETSTPAGTGNSSGDRGRVIGCPPAATTTETVVPSEERSATSDIGTADPSSGRGRSGTTHPGSCTLTAGSGGAPEPSAVFDPVPPAPVSLDPAGAAFADAGDGIEDEGLDGVVVADPVAGPDSQVQSHVQSHSQCLSV
jgi:hypothetical protein